MNIEENKTAALISWEHPFDRPVIIFEHEDLMSADEVKRRNAAYAEKEVPRRWTQDETELKTMERRFYSLTSENGSSLARAFISKQEAETRNQTETRGDWRFICRCPGWTGHHVGSTCQTCGMVD